MPSERARPRGAGVTEESAGTGEMSETRSGGHGQEQVKVAQRRIGEAKGREKREATQTRRPPTKWAAVENA